MTLRTPVISDTKTKAILNAAELLFGRYGYKRTSVEDIAKEAGIAKGTVYLYFQSKEEIFIALSKRVIEEIDSRTKAASETKGSIEQKVLKILEAKFVYLFTLLYNSVHAREILESKNRVSQNLFLEADKQYENLLAEALCEAEKRKETQLSKLGYSSNDAAALIIRCVYGSIYHHELGEVLSLEEFRKQLAQLTRVLIAGLSAGTSLNL